MCRMVFQNYVIIVLHFIIITYLFVVVYKVKSMKYLKVDIIERSHYY